MVDVFEEVEEQIRAERYTALAKRFLPWILGAGAAVLLAYMAYEGWNHWTRTQNDKASDSFVAALESLQQGDDAGAFTKFGEVSKSPSKGYAAMALMAQGGMRVEAGKTAEGVKLFDEAAKIAPNPMLADLARLKSALALLDTASFQEIEGRLKPLMEDKRPYRMEAREALAFAKLMAGRATEARGDFLTISQTLGVSDGMRERAGAAMALIDSGSASAIPAAVKAAQALPPPAPTVPGLPPGLIAPQAQQEAAQ